MNNHLQSIKYIHAFLSSYLHKKKISGLDFSSINWEIWADTVRRKGIAPFIHLALKNNPQLGIHPVKYICVAN